MGSRGFKIALAGVFLLLLGLFFWPTLRPLSLLVPPLLCGWYELPCRKIQEGFLSRHLPIFLTCLALAVPLCQALMKRFCVAFLPQQSWSWKRSLGFCCLFVSSGFASIGLVVMTHESAWLLKPRLSMVAHFPEGDLVQNLIRKFEKIGLSSHWGRLGDPASLRLIEILESQSQFRWQFDCGPTGEIKNLRLWLRDSPSHGDFLIYPDGRVEAEKVTK